MNPTSNLLQTERIQVRLIDTVDAEQVLALENHNRDFFQHFTGARAESFYTLAGQRELAQSRMERAAQDHGYWFVIIQRETEQIIGLMMLSEVVRDNLQSCWIGYFLDQQHNGKGLMTEAVKLVVQYAFEQLHFHRLEAGVMPHNIGSIRVLEKAGFEREGLARKNVRINGVWQDHVTMAIVNPHD
ncbi:GNAT family N-acetyltransferase [Paenibacillus campi]|uniref:GNAT family N-acetyltransferase n=1 Tax=Paenibacillus campi TaxID=3106031 RepID=UPI002AFEACCA|nr:GNAT family N-acetyltransferase [Paenibacillus sp. SGZ-1014]